MVKHFQPGQLSFQCVADLRSAAQDCAQNISDIAARIAPSVAAVVGTAILAETCFIALHEAIAKSLRRGVTVVVRTLRAVALTTLRVTRAGVQASLITLVLCNLVAVVVAAIVVAIPAVILVATILASVVVSAIVAIAGVTIVTIITTTLRLASILVAVTISLRLPVIIGRVLSRLCVGRRTGRHGDAQRQQ
jgi:hypothetical protein